MRAEWVEVDGRVVATRVGRRNWPQVHEGISLAVSVPKGYLGCHWLFLIWVKIKMQNTLETNQSVDPT